MEKMKRGNTDSKVPSVNRIQVAAERWPGILLTAMAPAALLISETTGQNPEESQTPPPPTTAKPGILRQLFKGGTQKTDPQGTKNGDELFEYAGEMYGKKFYDLAIDKYHTYVKTFPDGQHFEAASYHIAEC